MIILIKTFGSSGDGDAGVRSGCALSLDGLEGVLGNVRLCCTSTTTSLGV